MRNAKLFHDRLAGRLAALFGATSLALVYAAAGEACGKKPPAATGATSSGAGGSSATQTSSTGFPVGDAPDADPLEVMCFAWPPMMTTSSGASGSTSAGSGSSTSGGMVGDGGTMAGGSSSTGGAIGDAGTMTGGSSTTGGAMGDAGTMIDPQTGCPTDKATIISALDPFNCPSGWEARDVYAGPMLNAKNECCYQVSIHVCLGGGRPYTSREGAVTAPASRGAACGWSEGSPPDLAGLSLTERAALARAWTEDALLEHASVASFSRFSLALLAAGAPSELVEAAHHASLDEIRHARLCFALASAYAREDVQPGAFPLGAHVDIDPGLIGLATSTVIEGCIGETIAAVRAAEQLARAEDPAVRHALSIIADDEARHAELAWKTVKWAIAEGGAPVRDAVARAFEDALARPWDVPSPVVAAVAHGLLPPDDVRAISQAAARNIVQPAARLLLDSA